MKPISGQLNGHHSSASANQARILVIDTDQESRTLIEQTFQDIAHIKTVESSPLVFEVARAFQPHIILLSLDLEDENALTMCRRIKSSAKWNCRLIFLSSSVTNKELKRSFRSDADGHLEKPLKPDELQSLISYYIVEDNLNPTNSMDVALGPFMENKEPIDFMLQEQRLLDALRLIVEAHDHSKGHLFRVGLYSRRIALQLQENSPYAHQINEQFLGMIPLASQLHDIGNVGIDQSILNKNGRLSPEEIAAVQKHTEIGYYLLDEMLQVVPDSATFQNARDIALSHHEHWNGKGHPYGIQGQDIPLPARIVAVADVFDALTSNRTFRDAHEPEWARNLISAQAGHQFDPVIVDAFNNVFSDLQVNCNAMLDGSDTAEEQLAEFNNEDQPISRISNFDFTQTSQPNSSPTGTHVSMMEQLCLEMNQSLAGGDLKKLHSLAHELEVATQRISLTETARLAHELQILIDQNESIDAIAAQLVKVVNSTVVSV